VKDYGHMFRNDALAAEAAKVSRLALDISELLVKLDMPPARRRACGSPTTPPARCSTGNR
jgi:glycolate oxidase iron-sulfur subunit